MTHHYSPHTGELIITDNPADWMGSTEVTPPTFNAQTASCFWRGTAWEVVQATPPPNPRIAAIDAEILALEAKAHRPTRDALAALAAQLPVDTVDAGKITDVSNEIAKLRIERKGLTG